MSQVGKHRLILFSVLTNIVILVLFAAQQSFQQAPQVIVDVPIGTIMAWHKNALDPIPDLPYGWVECNGQTVDDPDSPLKRNGEGLIEIPNLNGDAGTGNGGAFVRGNTTSGILQQDQMQDHSHVVSESAGVPGGRSFSQDYHPDGGHGWTATLEQSEFHYPGTGFRFGPETRPVNMSVVWIMRIK